VSERLAAIAPVAALYKPFKNEDLLEAIRPAGGSPGTGAVQQ